MDWHPARCRKSKSISGDILDELTKLGEHVGKMISGIQGVSGTSVEQVSGLPQIQVVYNHERMAEYGINVDDINQVLETSFAGGIAGSIYEGERKFDIVLRLDNNDRNVSSIQNLAIPIGSVKQFH